MPKKKTVKKNQRMAYMKKKEALATIIANKKAAAKREVKSREIKVAVTKETQKFKQITVQNTDVEANNVAEIVVQNKIDYTPKVSIIIPVYNVEEYLPECLDSIARQTLKEIEIICVNDGSPDNSLAILKEYAAKDQRITIISRENKGVGYSRNQGIACAKGEFLAFMDPDDYYPSNEVLEVLYENAVKHHVNICGGSLIVYDEKEEKEIEKKDFYNYFSKDELWLYENFHYDYGYQRFIYKTDMIKNNKIYFPNYRRFQDPPFMVKAFIQAKKFYAVTNYTYGYRWAHKEINWTEEKVLHLLQGLRDNMVMAINANLEILYELTLNRIKKEYKKIIATFNTDEMEDIKREIMNICIQYAHNKYKEKNIDAKISVIIPIYNAEVYLRECLNSVVNQTLRDIEIICVNDGSTDDSLRIVKDFAQNDQRIKYIDKPNAGYGQAMNIGVDLATGEYIGIVEPDDFIKPDMYEIIYCKAKELDLDIVKADYYEFAGDNKQYQYNQKSVFSDRTYYNRVLSPDKDDKILYIFSLNPTGIFRKKLLDKYHIRHHETPGAAYQDNGFWFQTMYLASRIYFMDIPLYNYRQDNPNQSMKKKNNFHTIPYEYEFIDHLFEVHKELNKYRKAYCYRKFCVLIYHMQERLDITYWDQYLQYMKKVFLRHLEQGDVDNKYFAPKRKDFDLIIHHPQRYIKEHSLARRKHNLIVSLTSYPARINIVNQTIESLLNQSINADKIILWLAIEQFPNKENDLPQQLLNLRDKGLTIDWCHDIKSYKKLIPTLKKYPEDIIVTADDDVLYDKQWLEKLYQSYLRDKSAIHCHRAHKIIMKKGKILPYKKWQWCQKLSSVSFSLFFTGLGGVLYPPSCLSENVFSEAKFMKLCPQGDDIWFWANAVLNGTKIKLVKDAILYPKLIEGSQDTALWIDNVENNKNDIQIQRVIKEYPKILTILSREKHNLLCKLYLLFPYYYFKLHTLRKYHLKQIKKLLTSSRIDIKNFGKVDNNQIIIAKGAVVDRPQWFANDKGEGAVVSSSNLTQKIIIQAIKKGEMCFKFRGAYKRDNQGIKFPVWIDYKSIKIDGKEILSEPIATWHDEPYHYEIPVKDGQEVTVEFEQQYHQYTEDELKDTILKLNGNSDYIQDNVNDILLKLKKIIPIIDEETRSRRQLEKCAIEISENLTSSRIDIKNFGGENNAVITTAVCGNIEEPKWFTNNQGIGKVIRSNALNNTIKLKAINDGTLRMDFRGQDKRFEGTRYPVWIDYKSIKIDGKEILPMPVATWHDKPYHYDMPVKDGQEVTLEIEQQYHQYTEDELRDTLVKLNLDNNFSKEQIDNIVSKLSKNIETELSVASLEDTPQITADCYVPIGGGCRPAYWLRQYRLRYCSLPFDWMMAFPLYTVFSTLKDGITSWFQKYSEDVNQKNIKFRYVLDEKNSIVSIHAFPSNKSIDEYMQEFRKIFDRRCSRMRHILETSTKVCFICNRIDSIYDFLLFLKEVTKLYPKLIICLLNIRYSDGNIETKMYRYKNIKIYDIEAHDIHKDGNNKSINPNFWIGNEDLWNKVCSHLSLSDIGKEILKENSIKKIISDLATYRLDIKNFGLSDNSLKISVRDGNIEEPKWFTNNQGIGKVIRGNALNNTIKLKAINDGTLRMDFRGQDKRFEGTRYPVWIDYKSIKIDGKEILPMPVATWHDKPYHYDMPVKDGQEVTLEIEQQYHQYTEDELRDIINKLNIVSAEDITDELINAIYHKVTLPAEENVA